MTEETSKTEKKIVTRGLALGIVAGCLHTVFDYCASPNVPLSILAMENVPFSFVTMSGISAAGLVANTFKGKENNILGLYTGAACLLGGYLGGIAVSVATHKIIEHHEPKEHRHHHSWQDAVIIKNQFESNQAWVNLPTNTISYHKAASRFNV